MTPTIHNVATFTDKVMMFFQNGMSIKRTKVAILEFEKPIQLFVNDLVAVRSGRRYVITEGKSVQRQLKRVAEIARASVPTAEQAVERVRSFHTTKKINSKQKSE